MLMSVRDLAHELSHDSHVIVVDVRESHEIAQTGLIPTARHIPLHELATKSADIPVDAIVVCVCASGIRAEVARERLQEQGYPHVWNVLGGMKKWIASGYICEKV